VFNVGELHLAEERSFGENQPVSSQQFRVVTQLLSFGSSDVISRLVGVRSTSSRGAEKDVKSTSRGEEFQEGFILP